MQKLRLLAVAFIATLLLAAAPLPASAAVSDWQQGVTFYPKSNDAYASTNFQQSVRDIKATGADYIGLLVPWYQTNETTIDIHRGWNTPTDAALQSGIDYVHSQGMNVFLITHLDNLNGVWRAEINPDDRAGWFANYRAMLYHYADISQATGVEMMSLGVEMYHMTSIVAHPSNETYWANMISDVRARYSGLLTYGAQHSGSRSEKSEVNFWKDLDFIGLSAYFTLNGSGTTDEEQIRNSWDVINADHIKPLYDKWQKPILFTELGYRSVEDNHLRPFDHWSNTTVDMEAQVKSYEGLLSYWDAYPYLAGWHLWAWEINPDAGGTSDTSFTPQNKPAEDVLRQWYGGTGTGTTDPEPTPEPEPEPEPQAPQQWQSTASFSAASTTTAAPVTVQTSFTAPAQTTGAITNVEVFNDKWQRVWQTYKRDQNFAAGETKQYANQWQPTATGTYHIKVGVFDAAWQNLHWTSYDNAVLTVTAGSEPSPTPPAEEPTCKADVTATAINSSALFSGTVATVGQPVEVTACFSTPKALGTTIVNIEVFNDKWQRVSQYHVTANSLATGKVHGFTYSWVPNAAGTYHIKVGLFDAVWQNIYWESHDDTQIVVK